MNTQELTQWCDKNQLALAHPSAEPAFLWVDLETTGLHAEVDVILEAGAVLTDKWGDVIGEPYASIVYMHADFYHEALERAKNDPIVNDMHDNSGLWTDYDMAIDLGITVDSARLEDALSHLVNEYTVDPKIIRLAGSTVGFDKGFLSMATPYFIAKIKHRVIDVSTLKELCTEFNPLVAARVAEPWEPRKSHRSLPDVVDSIHEYKFYLDNFLFIPGS